MTHDWARRKDASGADMTLLSSPYGLRHSIIYLLSIVMTTGKWKENLTRLPISMCSMVGKFGVTTLCLKLVRFLQRKSTREIARLGDGGWGVWRLCYMQTLSSSQVWKRIAAEEAQRRDVRLCCSMLTAVGNEGAWLLPPRLLGLGASRRLPVIEMEIQEVMLQREEVCRSPCQLVCLFIPSVLYYCHFLFALTHNHSWHIITFSILSSEIHVQSPPLTGFKGSFLSNS